MSPQVTDGTDSWEKNREFTNIFGLGLPYWEYFGKKKKTLKRKIVLLLFGKNEPERLGIRVRFRSHRPPISLQENKMNVDLSEAFPKFKG